MELKDVIHFYLGCECIIDNDGIPLQLRGFLKEVIKNKDDNVICRLTGSLGYWAASLVKPILRPLSSMTEEEKAEYNKRKQRKGYMAQIHAENTAWLIAKGFDLFNLIPSGQAIDSTKL